MKRILVVSSFFAFGLAVATSSSALAQMPPPAHTQSTWDNQPAQAAPLTTDGPGNGLQIDVDVLGATGTLSLVLPQSSNTTTGSVAAFGAAEDVAVGYQFDQNALLLDIGFAATSGSVIFFSLAPTYRRYLHPLHTGTVVPFAQGSVDFGIEAPSAGSASFAIGFGAGVGGEFLFTKNMGLEALATLGYLHTNTAAANFNTDSIGLGGKIGLVIHL